MASRIETLRPEVTISSVAFHWRPDGFRAADRVYRPRRVYVRVREEPRERKGLRTQFSSGGEGGIRTLKIS